MSADHANISPEQWRELLDHRDTSLLEVALHQQPELVKTKITGCDHPHGAMPLSYIAMQRFDTVAMRWRNVERTGPVAQLLIDAGASIEGVDGDRETPLITAASYGDAEVAAVLISAGADLDAISAHNSGGVPSSTAVQHAAVFGMTDVLDLLVAAGARITSLEEAAAAGDVSQWLPSASNEQTKIRALVMAVDHQRIDVIDELIHAGTPFDGADVSWGRHPLRLAAVNGRVNSVRSLLAHGADRTLRDGEGLSALDHCRAGLTNGLDTKSYHAIEALLTSV